MSEETLKIKINLQLFASPEEEGRTEEPTERRLREAREKGKVAKTTELSSALILLLVIGTLIIFSNFYKKEVLKFLHFIINSMKEVNSENFSLKVIGIESIKTIAKLLFPVFLAAITGAIAGNVAQTGFLFTLEPLKPDLSRISFTFDKLVQRILFSRYVAVNLAKSLFKVIAIGVVSFLIIKANLDKLIGTIYLTLPESLNVVSATSIKIIMWVGIILLIMSGFDYAYQRWEHLQNLKMTVQEIKEERKQYEGDPLIKMRQRERHRMLAMRRMMQEVPKADVVVTNPTHYAVALLYEPETMNAAQVIAKGQDLIAFKIIAIAQENNVPVIENRLLARTLYYEVEIGEEIPPHLYEAVATLLAQVYRMKEEVV